MARWPSRTFVKYLILQVPGWLVLVVLLLLVRPWIEVPTWTIGALLALWVVKDLVLYPFLRAAYEEDHRTGAERLIGAHGVVATPLAPGGYIRIGGELWRAELRTPDGRAGEGCCVTVCGARGLTVVVEPVAPQREA